MTQEELKQLLVYDSETGVFTWLVSPTHSVNMGDEAGSINTVGYRVIRLKSKLYLAHRLAWLYVHGYFPAGGLDHKNRVRSDNRIENLRLARQAQNIVNSKERENLTGYRGVYRQKSGRYHAQVFVDYNTLCLGTYDTPEEAHAVVQAKRHELFGEFANGC